MQIATILCVRLPLVFLLINLSATAEGNKTATWLDKRAALILSVYGKKGLPTRSEPDHILTYPDDTSKSAAGLQGLVWDISDTFPINSTVFYSPVTPGKRSKNAFLFHHGHSVCNCSAVTKATDPIVETQRCRPGCHSRMPSLLELEDPGYTWWDLYNISAFFHAQGHDVFILSMPLKGVNLGPGSTDTFLNDNHWWFLQFEEQGDHPLRYYLEPAYLTVNYAMATGYEEVYMAGLSGGGWSTTVASAIDRRITASFPIAGSTPCAMRNPYGLFPGQRWTGSDDADYEQSCATPAAHLGLPRSTNSSSSTAGGGDTPGLDCLHISASIDNPVQATTNTNTNTSSSSNVVVGVVTPPESACPGRPAYTACNFTCQYLLAGLEEHRFQVQILHEYDTCCFSPHDRHDLMKAYEYNIRAELVADDRGAGSKHGWFTTAADNHSKHEVASQDKTIIAAAMAGRFKPGSPAWNQIPCDIMHQALPAHCAQNVDKGLPKGYVPLCPTGANQSLVPCS